MEKGLKDKRLTRIKAIKSVGELRALLADYPDDTKLLSAGCDDMDGMSCETGFINQIKYSAKENLLFLWHNGTPRDWSYSCFYPSNVYEVLEVGYYEYAMQQSKENGEL